ncbi:TRAP transporter small permease [Paenibacillus caseinilyticus]|uniref:C4-dicarboxylate ABC transporter permease n=1 Tax=Paenibacillus mucilaginosus K02 TaxID=997761 RepID=I0BAU0_9BACL|nr:TRAP transporter small permease [Paenibacillus mucilaginosus]AFH59487.1 C4-dicarboxylate ABC transporter permease [Paenibacillus mucilaginosus K02]
MQQLKRIALWFDSLLENLAQIALLSMILIVTVQVLTRKLFNYVLPWSEEVTLLLLVWFAFIGIAIGFRERLHLAIDSFTAKLPPLANQVLDKVIYAVTLAFGFYLVVSGTEFTQLMHESRLAATGLPNSIIYVIMPITGVLVCIYSFLQLIGMDTVRHKGMDEGGGH